VLRKTILATCALGALVLPGAAQAAVTLQPDAAPAGRFTRLDVRVPTERGVATKRVVLDLPSGFVYASYEPIAGWEVRMTQRTLTTPVTVDGASLDHEISRITWTATRASDAIPPGGFQDFGLAVRIPDGEPGAKLTFRATQVYADGDRVVFSGAAGSATPAPQVTLSDLPSPAETATARAAAERRPASAAKASATAEAASRNMVLAALAAAGLGILLGFAALVRRLG
jgi:uncharacterized protein YcnI